MADTPSPIDRDNPLPEPSMRWRRWLTYAYVVINSALLTWVIAKLNGNRELMWVAIALVVSNFLVILLYMSGASAIDLSRITGTLSFLKGGLNINAGGAGNQTSGENAAPAPAKE